MPRKVPAPARPPRAPTTVSRPKVFWVGEGLPPGVPLALRPTRSSHSWEGVGLSVSLHPGAWSRIARLGIEAHELRRIDGAKGRFALYHEALDRRAADWGVAEGWVRRASQWLVPYYDSEDDETREMIFDTEAEALEEARVRREELEDLGEEGAAKAPRRVDAVAALPPLRQRLEAWFHGRTPGAAVDHTDAGIELLNLYVAATWPALDGVWWDDRLDPAALSAPRGVILPHALPRWHSVLAWRLTADDEDD